MWHIDERMDFTSEVQSLINLRQHACERPVDTIHPGECGLGCNINWGVAFLAEAFFGNKVYRPKAFGNWAWAHENATKCSAELSAIDCFTKPLSYCGLRHRNESNNPSSHKKMLVLERESFNNVCDFASHLNKSVQWVHGQFVQYFLRPRRDVEEYITLLHSKIGKNIKGSTIGCHVRSGALDDGRKPSNVTIYIAAIDAMAKNLSEQGKPVGAVFFCSDLPEEALISSEYLQQTFPRPWKYVILPHTSLGKGDAEIHMRNKSNPVAHEKFRLVSEYYSDINVLANTDAFVGSESNFYPIVAALRVIRQPFYHNRTCFLDIRVHDTPPLFCEGSQEAKQLWQRYFQGYNGGSSFS
jgi:hypothetical protein